MIQIKKVKPALHNEMMHMQCIKPQNLAMKEEPFHVILLPKLDRDFGTDQNSQDVNWNQPGLITWVTPFARKEGSQALSTQVTCMKCFIQKCWVETWNHQAFLTLETPAMRQHFLYLQFIFKFADALKKVNPVLFSKLHLPRVHAWHIYSAVICAWKAFAVLFLGGWFFEGVQNLSRGHCWKNLSGCRKLTCVKSLIFFLIWALPRINLIKLFKSSWFLICPTFVRKGTKPKVSKLPKSPRR